MVGGEQLNTIALNDIHGDPRTWGGPIFACNPSSNLLKKLMRIMSADAQLVVHPLTPDDVAEWRKCPPCMADE